MDIIESTNHELKRRLMDIIAKHRTRSIAYRKMRVEVYAVLDELVPHTRGAAAAAAAAAA